MFRNSTKILCTLAAVTLFAMPASAEEVAAVDCAAQATTITTAIGAEKAVEAFNILHAGQEDKTQTVETLKAEHPEAEKMLADYAAAGCTVTELQAPAPAEAAVDAEAAQ